jgi:hypothetical protein
MCTSLGGLKVALNRGQLAQHLWKPKVARQLLKNTVRFSAWVAQAKAQDETTGGVAHDPWPSSQQGSTIKCNPMDECEQGNTRLASVQG